MDTKATEQIKSFLTAKLSPSHLEVDDDFAAHCGLKLTIVIVSEQFEGKRLLERHRMVHAALAEMMDQIHAITIKSALTPNQWEQQQGSEKSQAAEQQQETERPQAAKQLEGSEKSQESA